MQKIEGVRVHNMLSNPFPLDIKNENIDFKCNTSCLIIISKSNPIKKKTHFFAKNTFHAHKKTLLETKILF